MISFTKSVATKAAAALGTLALCTAAMLPMAASAGEVHNRVANQQARINQGVASGQLTRGEYDRDESRLQNINAQRRSDLRADGGHLTPGQRSQLNGELNGNSRGIYYTKHNLNHQPGAPTI